MANAYLGFGKLKKESLIREGDAFAVAPVESAPSRSASVLIMVQGWQSWWLRFMNGSARKNAIGIRCVEWLVVEPAMLVLLLTLRPSSRPTPR